MKNIPIPNFRIDKNNKDSTSNKISKLNDDLIKSLKVCDYTWAQEIREELFILNPEML